MVFIPHSRTYTSTARGSIAKFVMCESCSNEYIYQMNCAAQGRGTSVMFLDNAGAKQRAAEAAQRNLKAKLERGCVPVPCPKCGWYQQPMVKVARSQHMRWMRNFGIVVTVLGGIAWFISAENMSEIGALLGMIAVGSGLGLCAGRQILCALFNPNHREQEARIRDGQRMAITRKDMEARLAAQGQTASTANGA